MNLRDWLILIGVVVVMGILADGIRRMRKRNRISLKIDKQYQDLPDVDLNSELPNGGARPAKQAAAIDPEPSMAARKSPAAPLATSAAPDRAASADSAAAPATNKHAPNPDMLTASRDDADVDLLLDGDFKGVGQGADDYLSVPRTGTSAVSNVKSTQHSSVAQALDAGKDAAATSASRAEAELDLLADDEGLISRPRVRQSASQASAAETESRQAGNHSATDSEYAPAAAAAQAAPETPDAEAPAAEAASVNDQPAFGTQQSPNRAQADEPSKDAAPRPEVALTSAAGPALAPVSSAVEDDLDLSQPVTLLMEQMQQRSQTTAAESVAERDMPKDAAARVDVASAKTAGAATPLNAQRSGNERVEPTLGAATDELLSDAELDAPLTAEPRANSQAAFRPESGESAPLAANPHKPFSDTEPEKPKMKKSALTRLREEIQISFFDDLELAEESPVPDEAAQSANRKKSRKAAKKARQDKRTEARDTEDVQTRDKKPWDKAGSFLSRRKKPETVVDEPKATPTSQQVAEEEPPLLVMHVAGREPLPGVLLFKLVEACGMEFGDMQIYHRYEDGPGQGAVQFSMVNAYKPGVFDPDERDSFSTPGVNFFLDMSEPKELMNAFECMLATAQCLCDNLNAVLKDEHLSVMRPQTIEHYRQQIIEFERRRLAKRA